MEEKAENMEETLEEATATNPNENPENEIPKTETSAMDLDGLKAALEEAKQESAKNLDGLKRSMAEFTNYKRRTAKELAESRERGAIDALSKVLPIMDDFERALDNIPDDLQDHPWISGTALILKNMQKVMDEYKIDIIDPVGEEFDPNFHQALGTDDSDEYESGIVTVTLQKGYRSGDRLLRPALVRVAN